MAEDRIRIEVEGLDLTDKTPNDLLTMDPAKLPGLKRAAFEKAYSIMGDAGKSLTEAQLAEGKAYAAACDALEQAIEAQKEANGLREKVNKWREATKEPAAVPTAEPMTKALGYSAPGEGFVRSKSYQDRMNSGWLNSFASLDDPAAAGMDPNIAATVHAGAWFAKSNPLATKALLYSNSASGGAWVIPQYEMDAEAAARPPQRDLLDLVRVVPCTTDTIYWIRQDTRSSAATGVIESTSVTGTEGQKPESTLAWSRQTTSVKTIAVWIAVTTQELADAPGLQAIINDELTYDVTNKLCTQMISGAGSGGDLTGLAGSGLQNVAYSTATFDNVADGLYRGIVVIASANQPAPTGIVMNQLDWEQVRVMKSDGDGQYIMGPPTMAGPTTLWGLPLVLSNNVAANTAYVGCWPMMRLHIREDSTIKTGWCDKDFIENRVRILAELRAALTVRRPTAFARVTAI